MKREVLIKFGQKVREERIRLDLSQEELAGRAGVHRTYIGMIERAEKNITLEEYLVGGKVEQGTSIQVSFKEKSRELKQKIKKKIFNNTKYLPYEVTLNGKKINQQYTLQNIPGKPKRDQSRGAGYRS